MVPGWKEKGGTNTIDNSKLSGSNSTFCSDLAIMFGWLKSYREYLHNILYSAEGLVHEKTWLYLGLITYEWWG